MKSNDLLLMFLVGGTALYLNAKKKANENFWPAAELPFKISKTNFSGYKIENNKVVLIDETKALNYISSIVKKRTEFFEKQSLFWCKTNQWNCQPLVKADWLYYLGEDLFGLQRPNRQINLVFPLTEQNIITFNNKFKEYFLTDPDLVNYFVLNYIFAMIKTPVSLTNKYYQYWNVNNFINWYKNYLTQLGLDKYLPTDKGIELIIK